MTKPVEATSVTLHEGVTISGMGSYIFTSKYPIPVIKFQAPESRFSNDSKLLYDYTKTLTANIKRNKMNLKKKN